ncbi:MAG: DUF805 domain-containing protein [Phenylobacterium sp.]|uniref:DUF805 domain-containing protein n=1 Tax=Phenylobacterium sp. TaxID=1871053 RepID=UPI001A3899E7|nr:DUF805 domain-containing protein [Phenylobacterium sp.]MBL8553732.1 DUF805 domain-containing protein [Phenylobacterium sp.]
MLTREMLFDFHGRMRRRHWWLAQLGVAVGAFVVFVVASYAAAAMNARGNVAATIGFGMIGTAIAVVIVWVNLATSVKRLHDQNLSGWFLMVGFLPIVGNVISLALLGFRDSRRGENAHGNSPKYPADAAAVFD